MEISAENKVGDLLLELYSEEIPAKMQRASEEGFEKLFRDFFCKHEINFGEITTFSGPNRISVHITKIQKIITAQKVTVKGPKLSSALDVLQKFCTAHSIQQSELKSHESGYFYYEQNLPEKKVADVLKKILPIILGSYSWPKSMHWGEYSIRWVRPLKNILCLFDSEVLEFEYGHLTSNNKTYGHRFMSFNEIEVKDFEDYTRKLEQHKVILSRKERKHLIEEGLKKEYPDYANNYYNTDEYLIEEIVGLVEYPNVLSGSIPSEFLSLPSEVLITSMRVHQKYLPTLDSNGKLGSKFIFVSNLAEDIDNNIVQGNERVLHARLSDAKYFYEQDRKCTLESRIKDLDKMVFHHKIGTLKDKVDRLAKICDQVYSDKSLCVDLKKAAMLCKADLTTEVVGEFPELQGVIGKYYAIDLDNVSEDIAIAIEEHYMPYGLTSKMPKNLLSCRLSIIDKMDSLVGLFMAGERATGSEDPFALRRLAISIIRLMLDEKAEFDLSDNLLDLGSLIEIIQTLYLEQFADLVLCKEEILIFIEGRLHNYLKQNDLQTLRAVANFKNTTNIKIIHDKLLKVEKFLKSNTHAELVVSAYKRIKNIMPKNFIPHIINKSLFGKYEREVFEEVESADFDSLNENREYDRIHQKLVDISLKISSMFDNVLVDDGDSVKTQNRLSLLSAVASKFNEYIDFSKL